MNKYKQGMNPNSHNFKKGNKTESQFKKGHKINLGKLEEKSGLWKGDKAGYSAIHIWVNKWKGRPITCEKCGKTDLTNKQIHWANIDHKYRRVLDDYIRLCRKCHCEYDKINNLRK